MPSATRDLTLGLGTKKRVIMHQVEEEMSSKLVAYLNNRVD